VSDVFLAHQPHLRPRTATRRVRAPAPADPCRGCRWRWRLQRDDRQHHGERPARHRVQALTGGVRAWVNSGHESLLRRDFDLLDPHHYVIELLESVACDDETVEACRELRARGFTLSLDDFVADVPQYGPIVRQAQIVKLSVLGEAEAQIRASVARLAGFPIPSCWRRRSRTRRPTDCAAASGSRFSRATTSAVRKPCPGKICRVSFPPSHAS